ncbi:WG repeat-containing protein [Faucicola mancuniensis]|nr:WG repeat-containing protein [uncultured Moraxella sp.]
MIDKVGNVLIPCEYSSLMAINTNQLLARKNGKEGIINRQSQVVIPVI